MPSYKRRKDMSPGDVYYWEAVNEDTVCLLYQVINQETEAYLGNVHGVSSEFNPVPGSDGLFTPYRIFEMVEEDA